MRRRGALGLVLVALVGLGACGGDDDAGPSASPPAATGDAEPAASGGESAPAGIPLLDLASGSEVALQTVAATDKPTLYWFWAPF